MSNVSSVVQRSMQESGGMKCTVTVSLQIPPDTNETSISLRPIYDALQKHLREPCAVLSREETERRAAQEGYGEEDCYEAICSIGELGSLIEKKGKHGEALTVTEDPSCYEPRFGTVRDEILLQLIRTHTCEYYVADEWSLVAIDGELTLIVESPLACGWYEKTPGNCGFELIMSLYGKDDKVTEVTTAIKERLFTAYLV